MKRPLRFALVLAVALAVVPFLPLYIERTMLRSWRTDNVGDVIEWGWKISSLSEYWSNYHYIRREQSPAFWLGINVALAVAYALLTAILIDRLLMRWRRKRAPVH